MLTKARAPLGPPLPNHTPAGRKGLLMCHKSLFHKPKSPDKISKFFKKELAGHESQKVYPNPPLTPVITGERVSVLGNEHAKRVS